MWEADRRSLSRLSPSTTCSAGLGLWNPMSARLSSEHSNKAQQSSEALVPVEEQCRDNHMQPIHAQTSRGGHENPVLACFLVDQPMHSRPGISLFCQRPVPSPCVGDEILPRPFRESRCQRKQLGQVTQSSLLSAGLAWESTCAFRLSELPSEISFCFFVNDRSMNWRSRLHLWSCFTTSEVEGKVASTIEVPLNSSESIIEAICSHTRGSFSIS